MKHFFVTFAHCALLMAICLLPGCVGAVDQTPAQVASTTTLDEKAAIAAETTYTAASLTAANLVRAGVIDKARFQAIDARAYQFILAERAAYAAGNANDFATALAGLQTAIADVRALSAATMPTGGQ